MSIQFSQRFKFADWPNQNIPAVAAGVYAIWQREQLLYCGMSGREIEKAAGKKKYGLITRLGSHASGRLSGDQFCVYVANQLVIPSLGSDELTRFGSGELTLDMLTRDLIHQHLEYQYVVVGTSEEAYALESRCRAGEVFGRKPFLNPAGDK